MQIDLSELLLHEGKSKDFVSEIEITEIKRLGNSYKVESKQPVSINIKNIGKNTLLITAETKISLSIPCDRCLKEVIKNYHFNITKEVDFSKKMDEEEFIEEKKLNVDTLFLTELYPELPMKILCDPECKGLCKKCGSNLNEKDCGCDTNELDPRMSKILDVFNDYKEV